MILIIFQYTQLYINISITNDVNINKYKHVLIFYLECGNRMKSHG